MEPLSSQPKVRSETERLGVAGARRPGRGRAKPIPAPDEDRSAESCAAGKHRGGTPRLHRAHSSPLIPQSRTSVPYSPLGGRRPTAW